MGATKFALLDSETRNLHLVPREEYDAAEHNWGEGSASAWQALQRFEQRRQLAYPVE